MQKLQDSIMLKTGVMTIMTKKLKKRGRGGNGGRGFEEGGGLRGNWGAEDHLGVPAGGPCENPSCLSSSRPEQIGTRVSVDLKTYTVRCLQIKMIFFLKRRFLQGALQFFHRPPRDPIFFPVVTNGHII